MALRRALLALLTLWPLATANLAPARAAEQDICENRTGPDLVRCIEASARGTPVPPAPTRKPAAEVPPPARTGATVALPEPPGYAAQPAVPPEDCTGRTGPALRTCLAAGGRLSPSAAVVPAPSAAPSAPAAAAPESCDGKSGDALRTCLEHAARSPMKPDRNRRLVCTGYTVADQPLCVHRNTAIDECRNRTRYPDFDVCMRSQMVRAPEPKRADCTKVSARARGHCEARNRVYEQCLSDRTGYFGCLERQLGTDAVLSRR